MKIYFKTHKIPIFFTFELKMIESFNKMSESFNKMSESFNKLCLKRLKVIKIYFKTHKIPIFCTFE